MTTHISLSQKPEPLQHLSTPGAAKVPLQKMDLFSAPLSLRHRESVALVSERSSHCRLPSASPAG